MSIFCSDGNDSVRFRKSRIRKQIETKPKQLAEDKKECLDKNVLSNSFGIPSIYKNILDPPILDCTHITTQCR